MTARFDIIGDIHGCADQLEKLLHVLGYEEIDNAFRHPTRRALFLGDFVDRGSQQARTLEIVRPMIEEAGALAVMGNHEFNAICYATKVGDGFVRPHTKKNQKQHEAFLCEFPFGSDLHAETIEWFKTLPVYLDLPELGVVHACWCSDSFDVLRPHLRSDRSLSEFVIERYADQTSAEFKALERILKGPEHLLPKAFWFKDKDDHDRSHARLRWWVTSDQPVSRRLEFGKTKPSPDELDLLDSIDSPPQHPLPDKPVFIGHYWLSGEPIPLSNKVACVDYSVAKGGKLVAYRWDGESDIDHTKFVWAA